MIMQTIREMVEEEEEGDDTIGSLPANNLRGTFVAAYDVLTRILTEITWDEMLAYRSKVWGATLHQCMSMPHLLWNLFDLFCGL